MEAKPVNKGEETVLQGSPNRILLLTVATLIVVNALDGFYRSWLHDVASCFNGLGLVIGFMSVSDRGAKTKALVLLVLFLAIIIPFALALVAKRYL